MTKAVSSMGISHYAEYLNRQGLTAADAELLGLMALEPRQVSENVGFKCYNPGMFLPYPGKDFFRIRLLGPLREGAPKYLSPKGSGGSPVFFSPGIAWHDVWANSREDLVITEGEVKAYIGCRAGRNVMGIGGVDMQAGIFQEDIEWQGRRVFICFDKDAGYETGTYKSGVSRALGRLASSLQRVGAQVWVMNIPGEKEDKLGLDDYLRAGGTWDVLYSGATAAPEWCADLAYLLDKCVYVVGTDWTHVYNLDDGSRKGMDDFHNAHISRTRVVDGKVQQLSRVWQRHRERVDVRGYDLDPAGAYGVSLTRGVPHLNLWKPLPVWPVSTQSRRDAVLSSWLHFMDGLFGEHVEWIRGWVGHMLSKPWERTNQAVLVRTRVQGIGKSLFGEIVGELCGRAHWLECSSARMFDKFNSDMEGRLWVVVNELDTAFNSHEGAMNEILSQETMTIEHKGKNKYDLPNYRRWYMTANASKPCTLSAGQRRVLVIHPSLIGADTRGEWGQWVGSEIASYRRDPEALGIICEWFMEAASVVDGSWNPTSPVPITEAAEELAEMSMNKYERVAHELVEWLKESESGLLALSPAHRNVALKVSGVLRDMVRMAGGQVSRKPIKVDGKTQDFTVFELGGTMSHRKKYSGGGYRCERSAEEVRMADSVAWQLLQVHIGDGGLETKW